jgi:hypothetical protein
MISQFRQSELSTVMDYIHYRVMLKNGENNREKPCYDHFRELHWMGPSGKCELPDSGRCR